MKKNIYIFALFLLGNLLAAQDYKGFKINNASIPLSGIMDGGPAKDGIPSIDKPKFKKGTQVRLKDDARVLGVHENGIAKAYPINILNYHEIVNDFFGDLPVVVTFCPLCGSGMAFNSMIKGKPATFGVSGLLYNSDVLLYDRETESLWSQLLSTAVAGPLLDEKLSMLQTANTTWGSWKEEHPNTLVLTEQTGFNRDYSKNPYPGYDLSPAIYFPVGANDARFHPKEMVIGLEVDGKFKAYPFSEFEKLGKKEFEDTFQGKTFTISYNAKAKSAVINDADNNPVPAVTNFWFAWYAFHPDTEVFVRL